MNERLLFKPKPPVSFFNLIVLIIIILLSCKSYCFTECSPPCQNNGVCNQFLGTCSCNLGYSGEDCGIDNLLQCRYKGHLHHQHVYHTQWSLLIQKCDKVPEFTWLGITTCDCLYQLLQHSNNLDECSNHVPCLQVDISQLQNVISNPTEFVHKWRIFQFNKGIMKLEADKYMKELHGVIDSLRPLNQCENGCNNLGWCTFDKTVPNTSTQFDEDSKLLQYRLRQLIDQVYLPKCECANAISQLQKNTGQCKEYTWGAKCPRHCNSRGVCQGNFCLCHEGAWGLDCGFGWDEKNETVLLHNVNAYDVQQGDVKVIAGQHTPQIFIYDLPPEFRALTDRHQWLVDRFLDSKYRTHNPHTAQYYLIPHMTSGRRGPLLKMLNYIQNQFPYFNKSVSEGETNHVMFMLLDKGPRDTQMYGTSNVTAEWLRPEWNWANPNRSVMAFFWNGRTDGAAAGQTSCDVCFQPGKDILLPIPRGRIDGPLHGYSLDELNQFSPWKNYKDVVDWPHRNRMFFFAGRVISPGNMNDQSGRGQIYGHHRNSSGFQIVNSVTDESVALASSMANSVFCYVPYGTRGGDARRYMGAVIFGCLPVWFSFSDAARQAMPFEEFKDMGWLQASVFVSRHNMSSLHQALHSFNSTQLFQKRKALESVLERILFTSINGQLFDENGNRDAFQTIIQIFTQRLRSSNLSIPP